MSEAAGPGEGVQAATWIGDGELHSYGPDDGVNSQNIVAGGGGVQTAHRLSGVAAAGYAQRAHSASTTNYRRSGALS